MIKHIVMWNVLGNSADEKARNAQKLKTAFEGLRDTIPGMLTLEVGVDQSRVDYACDLVLYSEFDSADALTAYAHHPEHTRVREALKGLRIARHQVDYTV